MTSRERQVLDALALRRTNAEIAAALHISVRTVESHVGALLRKFAAPNRRALAEQAGRLQGTDRTGAGSPVDADADADAGTADAGTRLLVAAVAVLGPRASTDLVARVAGLTSVDAAAGLAAARQVGLVRRTGSLWHCPSRVGEAAMHAAVGPLRMRLEAAAAAALVAGPADAAAGAGSAGELALAADVARHMLAAGPLVEPTAVVAACKRAGELALAAGDARGAAGHLEGAIATAAADAAPDELCDLQLLLGEALRRADDPRHRELLLDAAGTAIAAADAVRLARCVLALVPAGWTTRFGRPDPLVADLAARALADLPADQLALRARVSALLSAEKSLAGAAATDHRGRAATTAPRVARRGTTAATQAAALAAEAAALAASADDPQTWGFVLPRRYWTVCDPDDLAGRRSVIDGMVAAGHQTGDAALETYATSLLVDVEVETGDAGGAGAALDRLEVLATRSGGAFDRWLVLEKRTGLALLHDDLAAATDLADEALAVGLHATVAAAPSIHAAVTCLVAIARGAPGEAVDLAVATGVGHPGFPAWKALAARLCADAGDLDLARRLLAGLATLPEAALADALRHGPRRSGLHNCGEVALATGDEGLASRVRRLLAPASGLLDWFGGGSFGPTDLVLGRLAAAAGDTAAARRHLDAAAAGAERVGAPRWRLLAMR